MALGRWFKDNGTFEMDFYKSIYGDAKIIILIENYIILLDQFFPLG